MPRYNVNLHLKVKIWQNISASMDFDGTPEELTKHLEASDSIKDVENLDYHECEYIVETEETLTEEGEGSPVIEVNHVTEDT